MILFIDFQLILLKGSMHEDLFKNSKEETKQAIWKDRIEPYIDEEIYKVNRIDGSD